MQIRRGVDDCDTCDSLKMHCRLMAWLLSMHVAAWAVLLGTIWSWCRHMCVVTEITQLCAGMAAHLSGRNNQLW